MAREIVINVRDDGAGIDLKAVRKKAIEEKILDQDEELDASNLMLTISHSGFSTADKLSQISGRGVGMDVVQSALRKLSGSISYELDKEQDGASFLIRLPISLAVTNAMFIRAGGQAYAIAARSIERIISLPSAELVTALNANKPSIKVNQREYVLIDLADYLGFESQLEASQGKRSIILVDSGIQNIAVIVEGLDHTQEIVVKNLGTHLGRIPIYSGATIRADGNVVLLLDLVGISYFESSLSVLPGQDAIKINATATPNVLVVDDSLTVRKAAQRDITALGVNALLAKDGVDAKDQISTTAPDMILLDIEMPRMDGFEFLQWLKKQSNYKHIPVVMISSRATEKHINKATQLGCSAFLGKPYLLENLVGMFNQHLKLDTPLSLA